MTKNGKSGELPDTWTEQIQNDVDVAILMADSRMNRRHILLRIQDQTGLDLGAVEGAESVRGNGHLTHHGMAQLFKYVTKDGRTLERIKRDLSKQSLAGKIAEAVDAGFTVDPHQEGFRKDQLIRILLAVRPEDVDLARGVAVDYTADRRTTQRVITGPDGGGD